MAVNTDIALSTLAYLIIYVKDTEKALPFYRDTLGIKVKSNHPGWVELETGATTLCLHGDAEGKHAVHGSGQPVMVFQVKDIHEAYEELKKKGIAFRKTPEKVCEEGDKLGLSADFEDADGNLLSVFGYVSK